MCVVLAALVLFLKVRPVYLDFAIQYPSDNRFVMPVFWGLIPVWPLLMVALLCMTANGGFDALNLSRPILYALTVGASIALTILTFVFIALYIRPGFTPRRIYTPAIYLTPLSTGLLVVLSLNQKLTPGLTLGWLWWPWTILTGISLFICTAFVGHRAINSGFGIREIVRRIPAARDVEPEQLARIATLDPEGESLDLLDYATPHRTRGVHEAATARLRENPAFFEWLAAILTSNKAEQGLEFLAGTNLAPEEQKRVAVPARTALERFISPIPTLDHITAARRKQLLKWERTSFPGIISKFSATDVDFSKVMPAFEHALRTDNTRRL